MAVYVDDMKAEHLRYKMCHMIADSQAELLEMVERIGVQKKWIQYAGTHREHFDIALTKRALAVNAGAIEITWRQTGAMCTRRRVTGQLGSPEDAEAWLSEHFASKKVATLENSNSNATLNLD